MSWETLVLRVRAKGVRDGLDEARKEEKGGVSDNGRNAGSEKKKLSKQRRADAALGVGGHLEVSL